MNDAYTIQVMLNTPAKDGVFDYAVPQHLTPAIAPGISVIVPFGKTKMQGLVLAVGITSEHSNLREITALADNKPFLTPAQMKLAKNLATRCFAPLSDCMNMLLGGKIRRLDKSVYRLVNPVGVQASFFAGSDSEKPVAYEIIKFLTENNGHATQGAFERTFGKKSWKKAMAQLIRMKIVEKISADARIPEQKKIVRKVRRSDQLWDEKLKLGNGAVVQARRSAILTLLSAELEGLPSTKIYAITGANLEDLKSLEKKGLITFFESETIRIHRHFMRETPLSANLELTNEQQSALNCILTEMEKGAERKPVLIRGVTGSGKTEIYLRATEEAIRQGKQVLMMIPEIALTPQILARFNNRFPEITGVYHSRLDRGERYDTWYRFRSGELRILIGPRSCFSVPLFDLGLIILDECHDDSYYQTESRPYFSAVQAAMDYAELSDAQLILGSATPTVAQLFKAQKSDWKIVALDHRATGVKPPVIKTVDMRQELRSGNSSEFSRELQDEMRKTYAMGKQSILFLNRRGSGSYTVCRFCGFSFACPNCDIPLTWHSQKQLFLCHFCAHQERLLEKCPNCGKNEIRHFGTGTEKAEQIIQSLLPQATIIRIDADTVGRKGEHERLLTQFANHEADILIGTQMVAKGLDFPDVHFVGVLLADVGTNFHDYRVDEHTYHMLIQVAGRAGRANEQGLALLQTFQPERYSIRASISGNYYDFYLREINYRKTMGYPPFSHLVRLEFRDKSSSVAENKAQQIAESIRRIIQKEQRNATRIIGPAPCFFARLNGVYRWHLILRGPNPVEIIRRLPLLDARIEVDPPSVL